MTRIVSFIDGAASASSPNVQGADQEPFTLSNNTTGTVTTLLPLVYKSVFYSFELTRAGSSTYRQTGTIMLTHNTSWEMNIGNHQGDELLQDSIVNGQDVILSISGNNLNYQTGNQAGHTETKLKLYAVRIIV